MMQKTANAKAKVRLRFSVMVWDIDFHYFRSHCLSYNILAKVQIQSSNNKNFFCFKKSKLKNAKPTLPCENTAEPVKKKNKKNEKKKFQRQKRKYIQKLKKQILATRVNTIENPKKA